MTLSSAIAATADQPASSFAAFGALAQAISGAKLVTLMTFDAASREACRTWSSDPESYPVSGTKEVEETVWTRTVLDNHQSFIGNDINALQEVFGDYELIRSLGCESCMNLPFIAVGEVLGTVNMLDVAGYFTPDRIAQIEAELTLPGLATFLLNDALRKGTS